MSERESLLEARPLVYEIHVCPECRHQLNWLPDDGEGMSPRAWCRGPERHLVVDREALKISVLEVRVA